MNKDEAQRRTRRSFLGLAAGALGAAAGYRWLLGSQRDAGIAWPLRKAMEVNGKIWNTLTPKNAKSERIVGPPDGAAARINGDIGLSYEGELDSAVDIDSNWTINVTHDGQNKQTKLDLNAWSKCPRAREKALFCCIEGWSEPISYAGVRFADAMDHLQIGRRSDGSHYRYVGLATPDEKYYVSIDMESARHPQTLLADEQNGEPLGFDHGGPIRLIVPIKYGIKSLKRVGRIAFSDARPPDFWHERGYDWYASL